MEKKYELVKDDFIEIEGHKLYRIRALKDIKNKIKVKSGDFGGYIEKEDNLSHEGNCWVYDYAVVFENAKIIDNAILYQEAVVHGNSVVSGNAIISERANICGNAKIYDSAVVYGNTLVYDDARVYGESSIHNNAKVFSNAIIAGKCNIFGNAKLGINANIVSTGNYIVVGPIGNKMDYITFYKSRDKDIIWVNYRDFNNTIGAFEKHIISTHKDNSIFKKRFLIAIEFAKNMVLQ